MRVSSLLRLPAALLAFCLSLPGIAAAGYAYPDVDGFIASIVGTPTEYQAELPEHIPLRTYRLPPLAPVPGVFWHQEGLEFSVAAQPGRAPAVFLLAGTGAGHDSAKMKALARVLYGAGFHVLCFSSPTYFNFIVNASTTRLPGFLPDDTRDLYRVMEQAWATVKDKIDASSFAVAGYSLGGIGAAFIAQHDESAGRLGFQRALMINPPVDLYNSVKQLDAYLSDNMQSGTSARFLDEVIEYIAVAYQPDEGLSFDEDLLFRAWEINQGRGRRTWLNARNPEQALVGLSFRVSSSAMVFAGDVMSRSGYITPAAQKFGKSDSLSYYAYASSRVPFAQYVDELLMPALLKTRPGATREQLLHAASLHGIEDWMRRSGRVWAITNADEIILAPGELDYLKSAMGPKLRVYPRGGHCGNILQRDTVRDIVQVLRDGSFPAAVEG